MRGHVMRPARKSSRTDCQTENRTVHGGADALRAGTASRTSHHVSHRFSASAGMSLTSPPPTPSVPLARSSSQPSAGLATKRALQTAELLISILGHLNQPSLARTSRVSKLWLDASTNARMATIIPDERHLSQPEFDWLTARLSEQPRLGHRIKRLAVGSSGFGTAVGMTARWNEWLMSLCPGVVDLSICGTSS